MAILGIVLMGLEVFCALGLVLLICGAVFKKRRKGLLISGIALCAPLAVYFLLGAVGALIGAVGP